MTMSLSLRLGHYSSLLHNNAVPVRSLLSVCVGRLAFSNSIRSVNASQDTTTPKSTAMKQLKQDTIEFLAIIRDKAKLDTKYIPLRSKKDRGEGHTSQHFKDHISVRVQAGEGGGGSISVSSICGNEFNGPDGGDGGSGGHVVFRATKATNSLCHVPVVLRAGNGAAGRSQQLYGASAKHLIVEVPIGTMFKYKDEYVGSLDVENALYVAARGGAGGKGNMFFKTDIDHTPKVAEEGGRGEKFSYDLELRTMADIGLIGYPNAGKSTLLRAISRARPKVASYPFTTRNPHVGVVHYSDLLQLAVADIPGLIEDAHLNKGLGHAFLRHVYRCSGLLYVIDASQPEPWRQFDVLRNELDLYDKGLSSRPHAVVANKIDLPEAQANLAELQQRIDLPVIDISAKHGTSIQGLLSLLRWLSERNSQQSTLEQLRRIDFPAEEQQEDTEDNWSQL